MEMTFPHQTSHSYRDKAAQPDQKIHVQFPMGLRIKSAFPHLINDEGQRQPSRPEMCYHMRLERENIPGIGKDKRVTFPVWMISTSLVSYMYVCMVSFICT